MFVIIVIENLFYDTQINKSRTESGNVGILVEFRRNDSNLPLFEIEAGLFNHSLI